MPKKIILIAILVVLIFVGLKFSAGAAALLWKISDGGKWLLPLVAVSAVIDSINPCAFSVLLLTIAFLFSLGRLRSDILKIGGFYILGIFLIYLLIGLGILRVLHLFNTPHFMARLGAFLLIILGLISVLNEFFPKFPVKLRIPAGIHTPMAKLMEQASLSAAFALGALVGLCEFPCTGGPYLMVLGLLHDNATYLKGLGYLIFYNLIFVLPLAVILLLASREKLLEKVQRWRNSENAKMKLWGGLAMILLGLLIFAL